MIALFDEVELPNHTRDMKKLFALLLLAFAVPVAAVAQVDADTPEVRQKRNDETSAESENSTRGRESDAAVGERPDSSPGSDDDLPPLPEDLVTQERRLREKKVKLELSLRDAVTFTLQNNLNVRLASLDNAIRERDIVIARSAFDPFFNVGSTYAKNRDPTVSFLDVGAGRQGITVNPSETTEYNASLNGEWVTGTTYDVQLEQAKFNRPAAEAGGITAINPVTRTVASADLRQPLLKGAWYSVSTADVRIAQNNFQVSNDEFERVLVDAVYQVEQAYWELAFAIQNLRSREKALRVSREDFENARKRRAVGTFSDNDVTTVESQWVLRKVNYRQAWLLVDDARDRLLNLMNYAGDTSLRTAWRSRSDKSYYQEVGIRCTSEPDERELTINRKDALGAAFENRPEYKQISTNLKNQTIRVEVSRNELLPSLDVLGRWANLGMEENFAASYESLEGGRFYDWLVGVEFSVPLSNRGPRSRYRNAREELRKLHVQKQDLENTIVLDVDRALRTIANLRLRVIDLEEQVHLQEKLLRDERLKLEVGKTIAYTVSTIENDLISSQTESLRSKADLQIAKADLYRAMGKLLERHQLWVSDN